MSRFQYRRNQLLLALDKASPEERTDILVALDQVDEDEENSLNEILDFANVLIAFADCLEAGYMDRSIWKEVCERADNIVIGSLVEAARVGLTVPDA